MAINYADNDQMIFVLFIHGEFGIIGVFLFGKKTLPFP
jgi:hypothetical protein